jgi:hypothetical protein
LATAVESYFTITGGPKGFGGHYATWESAINGFGSIRDLKRVRTEFLEKNPAAARIPVVGSRLPRRAGIFWSAVQGRWAMPFMGSDASVVKRSQRTLVLRPPPSSAANALISGSSNVPPGTSSVTSSSNASGAALPPLVPVQYAAYFTLKSTYHMLVTALCGSLISFFAKWKWGRRLLLNFPRLFSYGMFSHEGPSEEQMAATSFSMVFYARGYSKELADAVLAAPVYPSSSSSSSGKGKGSGKEAGKDAAESKPLTGSSGGGAAKGSQQLPRPDMEAIVRVAGPEPGYIATPKFVLAAAFTLLLERKAGTLPYTGGVLTPASAFRGTRLVDRLRELGIDFSVVQAPKALVGAKL